METIDSVVEAIHLPDAVVDQDQEWCEAIIDGDKRRFRFHDYHHVYEVPGLYEGLFYEKLKCCSPTRVVSLLADMLRDFGGSAERMRVLDVGAGNGMVGDELAARGAPFLAGVDIIAEARDAAQRDRPGLYDEYHVVDLTDLGERDEERLRGYSLNCLTSVAALGYGDIPPAAFVKALDLIETPGWVAFTIKEDFLHEEDSTGFSRLIRKLSRDRILQMQAYRRYRHRLSISGEPLYYVAMVASKERDLPDSLLESDFA
ncbi:MAG: class I SAM-dependent methyltransferase [Planctomycetota bacterium]|nr:MAG: class I SAM-dependent methyltransferase [Planctomycetota bacterium]